MQACVGNKPYTDLNPEPRLLFLTSSPDTDREATGICQGVRDQMQSIQRQEINIETRVSESPVSAGVEAAQVRGPHPEALQ